MHWKSQKYKTHSWVLQAHFTFLKFLLKKVPIKREHFSCWVNHKKIIKDLCDIRPNNNKKETTTKRKNSPLTKKILRRFYS